MERRMLDVGTEWNSKRMIRRRIGVQSDRDGSDMQRQSVSQSVSQSGGGEPVC